MNQLVWKPVAVRLGFYEHPLGAEAIRHTVGKLLRSLVNFRGMICLILSSTLAAENLNFQTV